MKTDTVFKRAFNDALDLIGSIGPGCAVPSEHAMSLQLAVSRTTVRKILKTLEEKGIISGGKRDRAVVAIDEDMQRYPKTETVAAADHVERRFMEWMLRDNASPGTMINELDMARRFGVATTGIREFFNRFQRFGLVEKRRNGGWIFRGFTESFAIELFEIREMFEVRSAKAFSSLASDSPLWEQLAILRAAHVALMDDIAWRYHDFSDLDRQFHLLVNSASQNRFVDSFYDIITMIFHYHYQWNKADERQRNEIAVREHLAYMDALASRDPAAAESACKIHLASAKETLIRSTK